MFKHLASLQAKPPCLGGSLVYLNSLPASPTAQTAVVNPKLKSQHRFTGNSRQ
ncbi:hypothetical protein [Methylobacter psychrophilus]|uniref:hypothetical protein n=1 Tax=Methylobacter psychrophilus TaxID=96941 RepID=UPI0021D49306|nr:hypothetical protein [Methylobacter psychrophilus]